HTQNNQRHSLRGRIFQVSYEHDAIINNFDNSYYLEYQFLNATRENFSFTAGGNALYVESSSTYYGDTLHTSRNQALFMQAEHRFGNLRVTLGGRYEWHSINQTRHRPMPLLRFGMNYQAGRATFIRSSFGQGFRYPAIAEKYASTQVGALKIFPNAELKPEFGWNAEVGVKQGFSLAGAQGFFDAAFFLTEFENMIEFSFGQHYPDNLLDTTMIDFFNYTGFKPYNISNARISGFEVSATGQGTIGDFGYSFHAGYTYTNPIDKDFDKRLPEENTGTSDRNILKYRFYHSAKASVDFSWRRFSTGFNADYHSFIINIDRAFEDSLRFPNGVPFGAILPGLQEYRRINNTGEILFNFRIAYEPSEHIRWSLIVNNLFNNEFMTRPAYVGPPRVYAVQLSMRF
ncbi:MAG TPA: TonB-dependent receptor, partial [Bacteroidales bacterium]|nr:TonB-dependent receptor [Bacteroidales bacterium]